jgi:CRP-like cAMP-binding protein
MAAYDHALADIPISIKVEPQCNGMLPGDFGHPGQVDHIVRVLKVIDIVGLDHNIDDEGVWMVPDTLRHIVFRHHPSLRASIQVVFFRAFGPLCQGCDWQDDLVKLSTYFLDGGPRSVYFSLMSLRDAVSLLAATPLFAGVDPVRLEVLAFTGTHLAFDAGETLVEEGTDADGAFLILSGEAVMLSTEADGRGSAARLDRGGLVGEVALTEPATWSATIRAALPVEVLKLERDVFLRLVDEFPEIAAGCLRSATAQVQTLADDLRGLDRHLSAAQETRRAMQSARDARKRHATPKLSTDPISE